MKPPVSKKTLDEIASYITGWFYSFVCMNLNSEEDFDLRKVDCGEIFELIKKDLLPTIYSKLKKEKHNEKKN